MFLSDIPLVGQYYAVGFPCVGQIDPVRIPWVACGGGGGPWEFTLTGALMDNLVGTAAQPFYLWMEPFKLDMVIRLYGVDL